MRFPSPIGRGGFIDHFAKYILTLRNFDYLLGSGWQFREFKRPTIAVSAQFDVECWTFATRVQIPTSDAIVLYRQKLYKVHIDVRADALRDRFSYIQDPETG